MKQFKTIHSHLKHHHRKYLFGIFWSFALIKTVLLFAWFFGIVQVGNTFAQTPVELNSGNITQAPFSCATWAVTCNLSSKSITSIATDTFVNHHNLTTLYLHSNQITNIESGNFNGLSGVTTLNLATNQITSIESGDFNGLSGLTQLYLGSNRITSIEADDFALVRKVQRLELGNNLITSIENGDFAILTGLTYLHLWYNSITSIENGSFSWLSNITQLHLINNQITSIESGDFYGLPALQDLELDYNQITDIGSGAFIWLSGVTDLFVTYNPLTHIENGDFNGLSSLQYLYLYNNQIFDIGSSAFAWLSTVETLDISANQITHLERDEFTGLSAMTYLGLYSNQITDIASGAFLGLAGVTEVDLNTNQLASIENSDFNGLSGMTTVRLNANQITAIHSGDFKWLWWTLIALYLQNNQINFIESGTFLSWNWFSKLNTLNLNPNCYTSGTTTIPFKVSWSATINNTNCVPISGTASSDFITALGSKWYSLSNNYYIGNKSISFNYFSATNTLLAPVTMQSTNPNSYTQAYYQDKAEVQYESWTIITYSWNAFIGILRNPLLFVTGDVSGLTGVASIIRFWALTHRIDFSQPVTIRIPTPGANTWDTAKIYSSDEESIYGVENPLRTFEKTGTVTYRGTTWYIEFTGTHGSRYVLSELADRTPPIGTITYNPASWTITSGSVIATITLNETGTITNNGWLTWYTFTGNGSFIFTFQDTAGNTGSATAIVDRIAICGNAIIETGETCDNGAINGQAGYCNLSCNGTVPQPNGWAGGLPKDICTPDRDCSSSYYDHICGPCSTTGETHTSAISCTAYSDELNGAYLFAYDNGITTIKNCIAAGLDGNLIRSHMAKMVSQFAIKVLKMKPDTKKTSCIFPDMNTQSKEMQFYATIACQLGLMGLDTDGITPKATFDPNDTVDRAQFWTILSRILRGTKYAGGLPFYVKHLNALKKEAIMNDITRPLAPEMRGRVMLMLQRSAEKK